MLKIYGHSDDCIEIESSEPGKPTFRDELYYNGDRKTFVRFPCGLVIEALFAVPDSRNPNGWAFDIIRNPNHYHASETNNDEDDLMLTFDRLYVDEAIVQSTPNGPNEDDITRSIENMVPRRESLETLRSIYAALHGDWTVPVGN